MMNLYEITNNYIGETYHRVYAWAETESEALRMATDSFKAKSDWLKTRFCDGYEPQYWSRLYIKFLFSADSKPFVTTPSDSGFRLAIRQDETQLKEKT